MRQSGNISYLDVDFVDDFVAVAVNEVNAESVLAVALVRARGDVFEREIDLKFFYKTYLSNRLTFANIRA